MSKSLLRILAFFGIYLLIFILLKPVFMAVYSSVMGDISAADRFNVIWHGLPMDCSMAGYFTIIPALLTIAGIWTDSRALRVANQVYIAFSAALISIVTVSDLALYGYWNFRLDTTPFFYFFSSPASALASVSTWTAILGFVVCILLAVALYFMIGLTAGRVRPSAAIRSIRSTIATVVLTAFLFIPIRGSFTVSTMNLSRSYFSANQRLNHAAINPLFSLMYSATHQSDFSSQFRYFDDDRARDIFAGLSSPSGILTDTVAPLFTIDKPDIYIIILESFSAHLMSSLGGEPIATGLDSIASNGLLFSNFYASGARTDRAIPAILSAFPAQPTTSLMKFAKKIEHAPSLPRVLRDSLGYDMAYYYGGDANFTNMLAYLVSSGFDRIVSDKDFSKRTSKWGAHDHIVFERVWDDIMADTTGNDRPVLRVVQTSSSHEPFEVPYSDPRFSDSPRKNAFAYADRSLTAFIDSLSASPLWERSVVIITPDHYGVYPEHLDDPLARHHVPLVITGGAVNREPAVIGTTGDQTAIASTLLSALGTDDSAFAFSHDLFDPSASDYAFFSEPGMAAFVTPTDTVAINLDTDTPVIYSGPASDAAADKCKAILQIIYDTLSEL